MTEELRAQLASLRNVAPMLNKATDEATAVVKAVESFIKELNLGLTAQSKDFAEINIGPDSEEATEDMIESMASGTIFVKSAALRFGRINGEFGIHVIHTITASSSGGEVDDWRSLSDELVAWPSCPREIKLRAVVCLPDLLAEMERHAWKLATAANEASGFTRSVMESLAKRDEAEQENDSPDPSLASRTAKRKAK